MRPTVKLWELWYFIRWVSYKKWDLLPKRENGCISLLRSNNIQTELDLSELQYLNKSSVKDEQITQKWDILFCMSNWSSHLVWKNILLPELENYSFGAFCSIFRKTSESALSEYIAKYLQSWNYTSFITSLSRWAWINNLRGSDLENIQIPLPPLETQKAIVAKLDQIFAELDQTKEKIQNNIDDVERLWKSVLNQAFEWDWEEKKLGEVCDKIFAWWDKPKNFSEEQTEFYKIPVYANGVENEWLVWFTDISKVNDICLTVSWRWTIWFPVIRTISFVPIVRLIVAIPSANINIKYLWYSVLWINFNDTWVAIPQLTVPRFKEHSIPVPPLSEQEKIVVHLDQVSKEVKALKSQYQSQLDNLEELKKSVLDKAFRWEIGE